MRHRHDFVLHVSWGLPRDSSICGRDISLNVDAVQASESDKRELDRASPTGQSLSVPAHYYFASPDSEPQKSQTEAQSRLSKMH